MSRIIKQIWRGCGWLPHVGDHPGTGMCIGLTLATGFAGSQKGGLTGLLIAALAGALIYVPMYLYGAYSRAKLNDALERRNALKNKEGR